MSRTMPYNMEAEEVKHEILEASPNDPQEDSTPAPVDETAEESTIDGETKAEKFARLASSRTTRAIQAIDSLGKLSSSAYEYTPEQIDKIFGALAEFCKTSYKKFQPKVAGESNKPKFSL